MGILQNWLVKLRLAETYMLQNNYKYAGILQESEEVAKDSKLGIWSDKSSSIQNNEIKNPIVENAKVNTENNDLLYIIIGTIIILTVTIVSITYRRKKRK